MKELRPLLAQLKADTLVRKLVGDGGPGSGNFGHKGRPGKVGGSGPGGGAQYRGGRSDIGYFSSRTDWLNGITGEKQSNASKILEKARKKIKNFEAIAKIADPGTLEGMRKNSGWRPGITPEEVVIQDVIEHPEEANELTDYLKEARGWDKHKERLINENLNDEEKKTLEDIESRADYPMQDTTRLFYERARNLLTAKACGIDVDRESIENAINEYISAGAANPPEEKKKEEENEPEEVENKDWLYAEGVEKWQREDIQNAMYVVAPATFVNPYTGKYDMDEVEHNIEGYLVKLLAEKNEAIVDQVREYTRRKERITGKNAEAELARGDSPVLSKEQAQYAKDLLAACMGSMPYGETLENNADIAEQKMFENKTLPDVYKAYYLGLKMRVLGLTDRPPEEDFMEKCYGFCREYLPDRIREIKEAESKSEKQKRKDDINDNYDRAKAENKVVIAGDAMSEAVDKLRKQSGPYTEAELKEIGKVVIPELQKALTEHSEKLERMKKEKEDAWQEFWHSERKEGESLDDYNARKTELMRISDQKRDAYWASTHESPFKSVLSRVRRTGYDNKKEFKEHFPGRSRAKAIVQDAYQDYPTEWIKASIKYGQLFTSTSRRGCYKGDIEIVLDSGGKETATHELGHRFESVIPGIKAIEKEFYDRRTEGEEEEKLSVVTKVRGYRSDEITKKDQFVHPYIGKVYRDVYEVVSMGFQYAFHDPEKLLKDPDYAETILGILAVG